MTGSAPATSGVEARPSLAAILACHNRRELTVRALRSLATARDLFDLSVVLFDDGSTDGTVETVRAEFPEVLIVPGNGDAFWNGGMYRAWRRALELKPDAYLWLNDDVELDPDALARLRESWLEAEALREDGAFVLVGATRNAKGEATYGGMRRRRSPFALRFERLPEAAGIERVDTFNGNVVLVAAATVDHIGILDPAFFHMYGDIDYGLRASAAGIPVLMLPGTLGVCERQAPCDMTRLSLAARWRHILRSPRGVRPGSWWRMTRKHSGIWAPLHFLLPYRRLFYPAGWLRNEQ